MTKNNWEKKIRKLLVGKKIVKVRYQTNDEAESFDWYSLGLLIELDDGTQLLPMQDDEGNGPGAISTNSEDLETIPIFYT